MLKRLELLGFKSFADKTAFEFGSGITCIVGPNGSGKSNVVDAIKWVLGEQSAKSLRGKEMADVIFNGSSTRRSVGFAEATLVFDNARRLLPVDADTVQLTRRVYRSGEGEYLINKNPSRLRDFRDLFMGTGAGADAYCVIEQGKVDVLLQSSTKDRRIIFEEAAGISRFKARKVECLRKLEHVDQNLLRLKDIVDEVEKQLRSVKLQAAKARRHQEYSGRLRELRLQSGLVDFHEFSLRLGEIEQAATQLGEEVTNQSSRCNSVDAKLLQVQSLAEELENQIRSLESDQADTGQEIARLESEIAYERAHSRDLAGQIERLRAQWAELSSRVAELERHVVTIRSEVERVEQLCDARRTEVDAEGSHVDELRAEAEREQQRISEAEGRSLDLVQAANQLHNELAALESHEKTSRVQRQRLIGRCDALSTPIAELVAQVESLANRERSTAQDRQDIRQSLENADDQLETAWISEQQIASQLAQLREERSAVAARLELLTDMERRHEGLGGGIQQVLASDAFAPNRVGLVADLVQVDVANAAMIERALGDRAAMVVVRRRQDLIDALAQPENSPAGLVRFLALDQITTARGVSVESASFANDPGFISLATDLVRPAEGMRDLAAHLLGQTILVRDLAAALRMSAVAPPGTRFVAATGHVLESDQSITAGDAADAGGIVSRKSQLRALEEQAGNLDARIGGGEQELAESHRTLNQLKQDRAILDDKLRTTADQAAQLGNLLSQRRQQVAGLNEELDLHKGELAAIDRELAELGDQRAMLQARTVHNAQERDAVDESLHSFESRLSQMLRDIEERQETLTARRIELAKTEGHLTGLSQRLAAVVADLDDRKSVLSETRRQTDEAIENDMACQRGVLAASSALANHYVRKERTGREIAQLADRRDQLRQQRHALGAESLSTRETLQQLQSDLHKHQLDASEAKHQRATLEERIREDYEVELSSMYSPDRPPDAIFDRGATQQEIQELRRKIGALGNVNLEALAELQELETRSTTLQAQINDLNTSKATLDEIIRKINQDSQRLFLETLEAVRSHFGELFRTLFGGGRADILLENETDVLESGIEIVARPPGKELRSLSLLSGGEKTLTTVALLMAVFRAKPSPFCILDEVDAALDEANIERYTNMLQQFSGQAQFIMITHSKKSMVCADVLYGITMQESGVSKRVSVRFEDVGEQGEISRDALERSEATEGLPAANPKEQEAA
jgi:chromosome segregation protein